MRARFLREAGLVLGLVLGSAGTFAAGAMAQTPAPAVTKATAPRQQTFPSPQQAADALTTAIRKNDDKAVADILGSSWRDFVPGTQQHEDAQRDKFLASWDEAHKIEMQGDSKASVVVGKTGFTLPIPIVKDGNGWRFDATAGLREITARYIGRNELTTIQTLLGVVDAEREYASDDPMRTGVGTYARRLLSSPGKKDGLYWETKPGEPESPLGPLVAKAQPGDQDGANGYFGYHYRLLYSQGPAAPGGARDYIVNGRMIGGFAVIAWPVRYGETGVSTFIVSDAGVVYERDLGPETAQRAGAITVFNPDKDWQKSDMTPP
ncbi:Protein of unknown function [Enhydrobacter aerosaccus]|uniref:DUF2950 domain-containing protein n=1 Tax=Enhydrobacter aerosaccus TaxID=225324 RepID=A0A1T4SZV8_9HYPH|nr:DUF2950 domain-containing protein [Enhydrobacter aerosaccus]SKA33773.1 Protein of unknown function [Enhydrobacter aerosaccus]